MNRKPILFFWTLWILVAALALAPAALSEDAYDAGTMRLLRHEGTVEIFDVSGQPRFVMDNVRFASGEALQTGEDGIASVGLDESKIVTLDAQGRVEFIQEAQHIRLNLKKGSLFLDVQKSLDENEGLDIQTTNMTVGIRGTVVFMSTQPTPKGGEKTSLGVLEGKTEVTYTDTEGTSRVLPVGKGEVLSIQQESGEEGAAPIVKPMTTEDIQGFVMEQIQQ